MTILRSWTGGTTPARRRGTDLVGSFTVRGGRDGFARNDKRVGNTVAARPDGGVEDEQTRGRT